MIHSWSPICNFILMENSTHNFSLRIYLSIPTRLLPGNCDYDQHHSIRGTNIDLNSITADQLGSEPETPGPKVATLPLCFAPLTCQVILLFITCRQFVNILFPILQLLSSCEQSEQGNFSIKAQINFTHAYMEWICCDSVTLWTINSLISHLCWLKSKWDKQKFASNQAKNDVPIFFSQVRTGWAWSVCKKQ